MKLAGKKGFTLLEILIGLTIFAIMISVAGLISHFTYSTFSEVDRGLSESSSAGARFLDTAVNRVMRAKDTEIADGGRTLILTSHGGVQSKFTLEGSTLVYYPNTDNPEEKQILAQGVKDVSFDHDYRNERTWVEGNPEPDGIWAPVYYYSATGPYRVAMDVDFGDLQMHSAAVPRLASKTVKEVEWLSPFVSGVLREVKEVKKDKYAVVEAKTVGMHTSERIQPADGTVIFVRVSALAAWDLRERQGQPVAFMGDVVKEILPGQLTMAMNPYYGGGMLIGENQIRKASDTIDAGQEKWYETESARLAGVLRDAKTQGVDLDNWKQLWKFLETKAR